MTEQYRTVSEPGESRLIADGSRFIGHIEHTQTVTEAETAIQAVRDEHPEATHVVPAYRIRTDPFRAWASDDGEPRGSAGDPILSVLDGQELENVLVTVVRYYGGTNLGIGGLVRAYTQAATGAIDRATIVERRPRTHIRVQSLYDDSGTVRSILAGSSATFQAEYTDEVVFSVSVPSVDLDALTDRLLSATSGRVEIQTSEPSD